MKIILVDDDPMALDGLSRMLHWDQFGGQLVGRAASGDEAVALIDQHRPDVVISDIRMPGIDGLELARYLYERYPEARMILISGHGEFEYAQQALQYQVTDYILKPITRAKLNKLEERLAAIGESLSADAPPWYACNDALRTQVNQALRSGDMDAIGKLLLSGDVFDSLSDRRNIVGIQLLNYLFLYQEGLGYDREGLDAIRQKTMMEYWRLTTQRERQAYLAARYYDLMEYVENRKNEYAAPIVSYCLQAIDENYTDSNFNISNLADELKLSLSYLSTVFKNATGQNISRYLSSKRLTRAQELLRDVRIPIRDVGSSSGYDDPRYFAKFFKKRTGMTPSEFRNLCAGSGGEDQP